MNGIKPLMNSVSRLMVLGLLFIFTLELCARLDDAVTWGAPFWGSYTKESLGLIDEKGCRLQPNARFEKWQINSHGFRGSEFERRSPEGVTRIMVLGSSETFGMFEAPGKEYPAQLQRVLNRERPGRYQVINGGVPGIRTSLVTHLYQNWYSDFEPDRVIYCPWFTYYLNRGSTADLETDPIPWHYTGRFEFRCAAKMKIAIRRFLPAEVMTALDKRAIRKALADLDQEDLFVNPPVERVELLGKHLTELVRAIQHSGAEIVLLTHPSAITLPLSRYEQQRLTVWRKRYPVATERAILEMERLGNRAVKEVARLTGVEVIDIDALVPKNREMYADHVHLTTLGAELVADLLAQSLLEMDSD